MLAVCGVECATSSKLAVDFETHARVEVVLRELGGVVVGVVGLSERIFVIVGVLISAAIIVVPSLLNVFLQTIVL